MLRFMVSLLLSISFLWALPTDSLNMRFTGNWPFGSVRTEMCRNENLILLAEGGGVFVFESSTLAKLSEIHTYQTISEMYLNSTRLFLYDGINLAIWDISDPYNPVLLSKFHVEDVSGIAADSLHLYLSSPFGQFRVYDISNPVSPNLISDTHLGGFGDIEVCGNSILALDNWSGKIYRIDVSDPANPVVVTSTTWSAHSPSRIRYTGGNYAYIAGRADGLVIVDISNPDTIVVLSTTPSVGEAVDIDISGNRAFVAVAWYGVKVLDISNVTFPQIISSLYIGNPGRIVAINSNIALCTIFPSNVVHLLEVDISDTSNPTSHIVKILPGISYNVAFRNQYAFLASGLGGIRILDISTPDRINEVSSYCARDTEMYDVKVKDSLLFIADDHGLRVLNISNPLNPREVYHSPDLGVWQSRIYPGDSLLLMVAPLRGLFIFNISNPFHPALVGSLTTLARPYNVALAGNYAIVADGGEYWGGGGLKFIDISDPSNPVEDTVLSGRYYDVEVSGNYAYSSIQYGVTTVDIQALQPLDSIHLGGEIGGVGINDTLIAVSSSYMDALGLGSAVALINVSNPSNMNVVGYYELPDPIYGGSAGTPQDVEFYQGYTFVATNRLGLYVYEYIPTSVAEDRDFEKKIQTMFAIQGYLNQPLKNAEIYSVEGRKVLHLMNTRFIPLPAGVYFVVDKGKSPVRLVVLK